MRNCTPIKSRLPAARCRCKVFWYRAKPFVVIVEVPNSRTRAAFIRKRFSGRGAWFTSTTRKMASPHSEHLTTPQSASIQKCDGNGISTVANRWDEKAGLLISCASSASITWELNASRRRPAFSSHLRASIDNQSLLQLRMIRHHSLFRAISGCLPNFMNRTNGELRLVELDEVAAVLGDAQLTAWRARGRILIETDKIRFKLG
jgi:hypothetical protein